VITTTALSATRPVVEGFGTGRSSKISEGSATLPTTTIT
jgi:hypothetical protein